MRENSVDQEETAHDEPFYLDLRCLQSHLFSIVALQELNFLFCSTGLAWYSSCSVYSQCWHTVYVHLPETAGNAQRHFGNS